jgi:hypothetical protein
MRRRHAAFPLLAGAVLAGMISLAGAAPPQHGPLGPPAQGPPDAEPHTLLQALTHDADFVFQGVVDRVDYRLADATPQGRPIPYTFVTFKVEHMLTGQGHPPFITLRFLGGYDGHGHVLRVSHTPLFDVSDRDVLFVKGNGHATCPLVQCDTGRLRLVQDQVYTDAGRSLVQETSGRLGVGTPHALPEVLTNRVGPYVYQRVSSAPHPEEASEDAATDEAEDTAPAERAPALATLTSRQLAEMIQTHVQQLAQAGALRTQPVRSVSMQEPLAAPDLTPTSPPAAPPLSDTERQQLEQARERRQHDQAPFIRRTP